MTYSLYEDLASIRIFGSNLICQVSYSCCLCAMARSSMYRLSHGGHRLRRCHVPMRLSPGYGLFKRSRVLKILPKPHDKQQTPFLVEYDIRRLLRGKNRAQDWGKALKLQAVVDRNGRGDLKVSLRRGRSAFYHRLVAFEICPCCTDIEGRTIEPFWVDAADLGRFEVHHGLPNDTHNCAASNLFVLYKEHHRSLTKKRRCQ